MSLLVRQRGIWTGQVNYVIKSTRAAACITTSKRHHQHSIETKANTNSDVRINEVGVHMINEDIRAYLFGPLKEKNQEDVENAIKHLKHFGLNEGQPDVVKSLPTSLELPTLCGNIRQHFNWLGERQTQVYRRLMSSFEVSDGFESVPQKFAFTPGWTRYDLLSGEITQVAYPDDDVLVFDVETLVLYHNCPVMAVALSENAWYSWCSERLVNNDFKYLSSLELDDLIPLEAPNASVRKSHKRLVVGHNVGFDRSFVREQYFLEKSGMRFLDTMSLHIACCGFTSEQRSLTMSRILSYEEEAEKIINDNNNNKNNLKKNKFQRTSLPNYRWRDSGSMNNLKDVHTMHCIGSSLQIVKEQRNTFVKGHPQEVIDNFQRLMLYCATDVFATYEIFKKITPVFFNRFQHPITLAGMLEMSTMYLPVNQNWPKYVDSCQKAYEDAEYKLKKMLERSANNACKKEDTKNDPWLFTLDWATKEFKLLKASQNVTNPESKPKPVTYEDVMFGVERLRNNPLYNISSFSFKKKTEQMSQELELSEAMKKALSTSKWIPKTTQFLCNYPSWYRELCPKPTDENWQPGPALITTRTRSTPSLMRLTWKGYPMYHHEEHGWGYLCTLADLDREKVEEEQQAEEKEKLNREKDQADGKKVKKKKPKKPKKTPMESKPKEYIYVNDKIFRKLPHKDGEALSVGNPLAKSFVSKINEGVISSEPPNLARLALEFYTNISYWENNEKRIKNQKLMWLNKDSRVNDDELVGAILPLTIVAGTITRRASESTWLTASNYKKGRIGCELKTLIQAPKGYSIVGADVDSQELWIGSTIGDSLAKIHGSTAIGWMNLQGKKSNGTDMHSKTAQMMGISRDQAKVFNYGRMYGAGSKFAESLLMQFDPELSADEAKRKATTMYKQTKGSRVKKQTHGRSDEQILEGVDLENEYSLKWRDGTESHMFNKLEEIACDKHPRTPALKSAITQTLEPSNVGDNFITSRINWVVQSSAVDFLHIMLVCMNWLIEEYDIDARFIISIHDEVRYMVKEEDKYRAALALQITNLLTRALFSYELGFDDLPMSVAFFSAVDIDRCLRKEPDLEFVTPSNPAGLTYGSGIPKGLAMDIYQILEKTNGRLTKPSSSSAS